jgi:hypothetical protein
VEPIETARSSLSDTSTRLPEAGGGLGVTSRFRWRAARAMAERSHQGGEWVSTGNHKQGRSDRSGDEASLILFSTLRGGGGGDRGSRCVSSVSLLCSFCRCLVPRAAQRRLANLWGHKREREVFASRSDQQEHGQNLRIVWRQSATPVEARRGVNAPAPTNYQSTPLMAGACCT